MAGKWPSAQHLHLFLCCTCSLLRPVCAGPLFFLATQSQQSRCVPARASFNWVGLSANVKAVFGESLGMHESMLQHISRSTGSGRVFGCLSSRARTLCPPFPTQTKENATGALYNMGMDPANVVHLAKEAGLPGYLSQPMPLSWLVVRGCQDTASGAMRLLMYDPCTERRQQRSVLKPPAVWKLACVSACHSASRLGCQKCCSWPRKVGPVGGEDAPSQQRSAIDPNAPTSTPDSSILVPQDPVVTTSKLDTYQAVVPHGPSPPARCPAGCWRRARSHHT